MEGIVPIIPAYNPGRELIAIVQGLKAHFRRVVVVNDGSAEGLDVFTELSRTEGVTLLSHPVNRGKGAALKTAFAHLLTEDPDLVGAVTVDADGQHSIRDVLRVAEALARTTGKPVLGVRTFKAGVPFRSRLGNLWTIGEFRLLTGRRIRDTQSGLRGIPVRFLPELVKLPGDRYEYEIRMLVHFAFSGGIVQLPIETVYVEGNRSSHFRPFPDTFRTQRALFAAVLTARFGW